MTGKPNTLIGNEYWVRCPECGDSTARQYVAHLSINVESGAFHCLRCGWSGYLTLSQLLTLVADVGVLDVDFEYRKPSGDPEDLRVGPGSTRYSLLERYHLFDPLDGEPWDGFIYRDPRGRATGYLLRRGDRSISYGRRTYLYPDPLGGPSTVLRIVEGPYDVLYPEDVAVGGVINPDKVYKDLAPYEFIFCPDGDIWNSPDLRRDFFIYLYPVLKAGVVRGVEYLQDNLDPDQVPVEERILFTPRECLELFSRATGLVSRGGIWDE